MYHIVLSNFYESLGKMIAESITIKYMFVPYLTLLFSGKTINKTLKSVFIRYVFKELWEVLLGSKDYKRSVGRPVL